MKSDDKTDLSIASESKYIEGKRGRVGRPLALEATVEILRQLRGLSRIQATHDEMAAYFSVAPSTFQAFLKRSPDAALEIERGRSEGKISLRRLQFRMAEKNPAMLIFLGKNYLSQSDKVQQSSSGEIAIYIDSDDAQLLG